MLLAYEDTTTTSSHSILLLTARSLISIAKSCNYLVSPFSTYSALSDAGNYFNEIPETVCDNIMYHLEFGHHATYKPVTQTYHMNILKTATTT